MSSHNHPPECVLVVYQVSPWIILNASWLTAGARWAILGTRPAYLDPSPTVSLGHKGQGVCLAAWHVGCGDICNASPPGLVVAEWPPNDRASIDRKR